MLTLPNRIAMRGVAGLIVSGAFLGSAVRLAGRDRRLDFGRGSMKLHNECPLTPALLHLLQTSVDASTTNAKRLAQLLCRSPATIRTEFQRICEVMEVDSRPAAWLVGLRAGWISLDPVSPEEPELFPGQSSGSQERPSL